MTTARSRCAEGDDVAEWRRGAGNGGRAGADDGVERAEVSRDDSIVGVAELQDFGVVLAAELADVRNVAAEACHRYAQRREAPTTR
jgi:hypothetical protein